MKIAVLISGEYRAFDICRPTMEFLNDPNVDVYISTWEQTIHNVPKIKKHYVEKITVERIKDDLNRDAMIKVDKIDVLLNLPVKCSVPMIYRWKQGMEMIKKSGIHYDYIIITRTDLFFSRSRGIESISFHQFKNTLGSTWSGTEFLNDLFLISSYKKIEELIENISIDEWLDYPSHYWHHWWWKHASTVFDNITSYHDEMSFTICRYFAKKHMTFDSIVDIENDWQDLKLLELVDTIPSTDHLSSVTTHSLERLQYAQKRWDSGHYNQYIL